MNTIFKVTVLLSTLFLFHSTRLFADSTDFGHWRVIDNVKISANTPSEIEELLMLHSKQFRTILDSASARSLAGLQPRVLKSLYFTEKFLEWEGPTKCQPGDPRLKITAFPEIGGCYQEDKSDRKKQKCFVTKPGVPSPYDPCGQD